MNYRHSFHAGNFADVVKHITLIMLLQSLGSKPTPYCYIDTHAGAGYYDLFSDFASKSKEYVNGIEKVLSQEKPPVAVQNYIRTIHQINNRLMKSTYASLRYYPGSTLIARHCLRPQDHLIACELQPQVYQSLKETFAYDKAVSVHHMDGFLGLKAFLPPRERRGLILIDPPYENPDEFMRIVRTLPIALKRFETGVYAIWFPIKEKHIVQRFYNTLKSVIKRPALAVELTIYPDLPTHLNGCGMVIINPPWQLEKSLKDTLPWLWRALSVNQQGQYQILTLQ